MDQKLISQANAITLSRYDFSVIEKRCIYCIIKKIRDEYIETDNKHNGEFSNLYIKLKLSDLQRLGDKTGDVYESLKNLADRGIEIDNEYMWLYVHFINYAKHIKTIDSEYYEVEISKEILPYFVELAEQFTTYDLTVAIALKSTYSQRFYEFCCQYKNRTNKTFFIEVDKLRSMLKIEGKYKLVADLKKRVLDVAQKELKELYDQGQCELYFDYRVKDTKGRKILSYFFEIHTKEQEKDVDYRSVSKSISRISEILQMFFPKDQKYIKRVLIEVQLKPQIAIQIAEKLDQKVFDYEKNEIPPIIRFVLREDFGI